jgi:photosystem II stability/assembly factor-like uncharacterized protein
MNKQLGVLLAMGLVVVFTACGGPGQSINSTPAPPTAPGNSEQSSTSAPGATQPAPAVTGTAPQTSGAPAGAGQPVSAIARPKPVMSTGAGAPEQAVLYRQDFESGQADRWVLEKNWNVVQDSDGNRALYGQGHEWASYAGDSWSDYTLGLRVKLEQGGIHLNYRWHGGTRYFVGFNENGLYLNKTISPQEQPGLAQFDEHYDTGRWYEIEITGNQGHLTVAVDGVNKITFDDADPHLGGGIALEGLDDAKVWVDDVTITGPVPAGMEFQWVKTGGPIGGLGYDVRMRPDSPGTMYVTDTWSGVNLSRDSGISWSASNFGILTRTGLSGDAIPVFSLTIDPHDNDVIWAGTQNSRGIYKSTDGGQTWTEKDRGIAEGEGIAFRGFTVDPEDSNIVYAAAEISSFVWAGEPRNGREFDMVRGVVYKTTDGGETWTDIWRGDNLARYVWIDPRDSDTLYVSTGIFDREAANSDPVAGVPGGVGILKSTDAGRTWRVLGQSEGLEDLYVGTLFMKPADPDVLLAGTGNIQYLQNAGVYLSTDAGETWRKVLSTGNTVSAVEFAAADPDIAYAAGPDAVYRSQDGGQTWQKMTTSQGYWGAPGTRAGFPIDLQVDTSNPDRLFANNYGGGNFLSEDGGRTWVIASQGYTGAQLHDIAVDAGDPNKVYVIGRTGPFRSDSGGASWQGLNHEPAVMGEWYAVALDPAHPGTVIITDEHQGVIFRSTDSGDHWTMAFRHPEVNASSPSRRMGFKDAAFAPSNPDVVYAGMAMNRNAIDQRIDYPSFGVYRSTDNGRTWQAANDATSAAENINALAIDPGNESIVYAGTLKSGVIKTVDGGRTWQKMNNGLRSLDVRAVAVDPHDPQVVYAGTEGNSVFKSIDGGATWTQASGGMDLQATIRAVVTDPAHPGIVFAGDTRTGVYRSADGGNTWAKMNDGLRTRAVKALAISSDGSYLYAATEGEGVFTVDVTPAG